MNCIFIFLLLYLSIKPFLLASVIEFSLSAKITFFFRSDPLRGIFDLEWFLHKFEPDSLLEIKWLQTFAILMTMVILGFLFLIKKRYLLAEKAVLHNFLYSLVIGLRSKYCVSVFGKSTTDKWRMLDYGDSSPSAIPHSLHQRGIVFVWGYFWDLAHVNAP